MHIFMAFFALFIGYSNLIFCGERGTSAPFISGDTFRAHADHIFDETTPKFRPEKVRMGDVVFVKTDWDHLNVFFTKYHPKISNPYILLTHNSDHSIPGPFSSYLDDPKLLGWFGQNVEGDPHPKLHPIPIGIANKFWEHGNPRIFSAYLPAAKNQNRPNLCYMNFQPSTCPKERPYVWNLFAKEPWCVVSPSKAIPQYLQDLSISKFVLSPRGNGVDCHRTWEALLMGAIPIVRTSTIDSLFDNLPVLIVDNWEILTESYLNEQYEIMQKKKFNLEKIFSEYWIKQIKNGSKK